MRPDNNYFDAIPLDSNGMVDDQEDIAHVFLDEIDWAGFPECVEYRL